MSVRRNGLNHVVILFTLLTISVFSSLSSAYGSYSITTNTNTVQPGQTVTAQWSASPAGSRDWVGWFRAGDPNSAFDPTRWSYTGGRSSAAFSIAAPSAPGTYEFRYLRDDSFTDFARTQSVTIPGTSSPVAASSSSGYSLNVPVNVIQPGQTVTVNWSVPAGGFRDWIAWFRVGDPNSAFDASRWRYTGGATSGSFAVTAPATNGTYEFRYLLNDGFGDVTRSQTVTIGTTGTTSAASVASSLPYSLGVNPASVLPGQSITVNWAAFSGNSKDWIALFKVGDPDSAFDASRWRYTGGATSGSFAVTAPATNGTYEFRYLLNDQFLVTTRSPSITVGSGSTTLPNTINSTNTSLPPPPVVTSTTSTSGWKDSSNGFHSFLVFEPLGSFTDSQVISIAPRYDFGWSARYVSQLKTGNPELVAGTYFTSIAGDWNWVSANRPDWILYKCDRVTPVRPAAFNYNPVLDISNPEVIDYKFNELRGLGNNVRNAVAWDNFSLGGEGACGVYDRNGNWVQKFNGRDDWYAEVVDPAWTDAAINYARSIRDRLKTLPNPVLLIPNVDVKVVTGDPQRLANFISAVDGVLLESGLYSPVYAGDPRQLWLRGQRFIEAMQAAGKAVYSIEYPYNISGASIPQSYIQFTLASYFMSKGRAAGLYIPNHDGGHYFFQTAWRSEFDAAAPMGTPCGAMYQTNGSGETGTWTREHTGGVSIVNSSASSTFTVALPGGSSYRDLYGNSVGSSVTLLPKSGIVLLKNTPGACSN